MLEAAVVSFGNGGAYSRSVSAMPGAWPFRQVDGGEAKTARIATCRFRCHISPQSNDLCNNRIDIYALCVHYFTSASTPKNNFLKEYINVQTIWYKNEP